MKEALIVSAEALLSESNEKLMWWARLGASLFPGGAGVLANIARPIFLPILIPIGYAGYKLEQWVSSSQEEGDSMKSIAELREERLKREESKQHYGEKHFKKTIFEKNAPKGERNAFNRHETMKEDGT